MKSFQRVQDDDAVLARRVANLVVDDLAAVLCKLLRDDMDAFLRELDQRLLKPALRGQFNETRPLGVHAHYPSLDLNDDPDAGWETCRSQRSGHSGFEVGMPRESASDSHRRVTSGNGVCQHKQDVATQQPFDVVPAGPAHMSAPNVLDNKASPKFCRKRTPSGVEPAGGLPPSGSSEKRTSIRGGVASWFRGGPVLKSSSSAQNSSSWNNLIRMITPDAAPGPSVKGLEEMCAADLFHAEGLSGNRSDSGQKLGWGRSPPPDCRAGVQSLANSLTSSPSASHQQTRQEASLPGRGGLEFGLKQFPSTSSRRPRKKAREVHEDTAEQQRASPESAPMLFPPNPHSPTHCSSGPLLPIALKTVNERQNIPMRGRAAPQVVGREAEPHGNGAASCSSTAPASPPTRAQPGQLNKLVPLPVRRTKSAECVLSGCHSVAGNPDAGGDSAQRSKESTGSPGRGRSQRRTRTIGVVEETHQPVATPAAAKHIAKSFSPAKIRGVAEKSPEVVRSPPRAFNNAARISVDTASTSMLLPPSFTDAAAFRRELHPHPGGTPRDMLFKDAPLEPEHQDVDGDDDDFGLDDEEEDDEEYTDSEGFTESSESWVDGGQIDSQTASSPDLYDSVGAPLWLRMCGIQAIGQNSRPWQIYCRSIFFLGLFSLVVSLYDTIQAHSHESDPEDQEVHYGFATGRTAVQFRHSSDMILAFGSFVALFTLWKYARTGLLGSSEALLASYARRQGVVEAWAKMSTKRGCAFFLLWLLAVVSRFFASWRTLVERGVAPALSDIMHRDEWLLPLLSSFAFVISSAYFMLIAHAMLHVTSALTIMIDAYCLSFVQNPNLELSVREWNMLQAVLRNASNTLEVSFLVFQTTAMLSLMLKMGSLYLRGAEELWFLFSVLPLSIADARLFYKAAEVTEKCTRVPALINSLTFGLDVDRNRHYLVEYVNYSAAGFYVGEVRLTQAMALKLTYLSGLVAFGVFTKVSSEN